MLKTLSISNYVIITKSEILFSPGLNMITGETGAGKSILLGALGLVLGRRADTQVLFDATEKAIVEAVFDDAELRVQSLLQENDLDVRAEVLLRREIAPNGRSRAFVNDSPVTLDTMTEIGAALMDVHQQFETLEIQHSREQYLILDAYCGAEPLRIQYTKDFERYSSLNARLKALKAQQESALKEKDYLTFQLDEFEALQLEDGGIAQMEEEFKLQSGAEEIKVVLSEIVDSLSGERSMIELLRLHIRTLSRHAQGNSRLTEYVQKLQSLMDSAQDLSKELAHFEEGIDPDPLRRQQLEEKLNVINRMMVKHHAQDESALMEIRRRIEDQLTQFENLDTDIASCESQITSLLRSLESQAAKISTLRHVGAPKLAKLVSDGLHELAMKHALLHIEVTDSGNLHPLGSDLIEFLFAPNLGSEPKPIKKVASGGELSRLNLCLKSAVSDQMALPTLVFDEIDAGISGEVAMRMGQQLKSLSQKHQVIMITHSPQIAAQAGHHLQVTKSDKDGRSIAQIRPLLPEDRITEIAKMLSGDPPTQAAILNARTLIET